MAAAIALTPEHFRDTATLKDDSLDVVATITTEKGFQLKRGLLGLVNDDNFIRVGIDKKTGEVRYFVYQRITYLGGWRNYATVNYETTLGPEQKPLDVLSREVGSCSPSLGCFLTEQFQFEVPVSLVREIVARYAPGAAVGWRFKYLAQDGTEWQDGLLPAELVGAQEAAEAYRSAHGFTPTNLASPGS